jgi:hypothetical protein
MITAYQYDRSKDPLTNIAPLGPHGISIRKPNLTDVSNLFCGGIFISRDMTNFAVEVDAVSGLPEERK